MPNLLLKSLPSPTPMHDLPIYPSPTGHSSLKLKLIPSKLIYLAGERVTGMLEVGVSSDVLALGEIGIEFSAFEELRSLSHTTTKRLFSTPLLFQSASLPPSNAIVPGALPIAGTYYPALKGRTRFPFSFDLSKIAPSSCALGSNATTRYELRGYASSLLGGEVDVRSEKKSVKVVERWGDWNAADAKWKVGIERKASEKLRMGGEGLLEVTAEVGGKDGAIGEGEGGRLFWTDERGEGNSRVQVKVAVKNGTKKTVSGLKITLCRRLRIIPPNGGRPNVLAPLITATLASDTFRGAAFEFVAGERREVSIYIDLPRDGKEECMSVRKGTLFELDVYARVEVECGFLAKDLAVELGIWIAHPLSLPPAAHATHAKRRQREIEMSYPTLPTPPQFPPHQHHSLPSPPANNQHQMYTYPFQASSTQQYNEFGSLDPTQVQHNPYGVVSSPSTPHLPSPYSMPYIASSPVGYVPQLPPQPYYAPPPPPPQQQYIAFDPAAPILTQSRFLGSLEQQRPASSWLPNDVTGHLAPLPPSSIAMTASPSPSPASYDFGPSTPTTDEPMGKRAPPPSPSSSSRFYNPSPFMPDGAMMEGDDEGLDTIGEDGESQAGTLPKMGVERLAEEGREDKTLPGPPVPSARTKVAATTMMRAQEIFAIVPAEVVEEVKALKDTQPLSLNKPSPTPESSSPPSTTSTSSLDIPIQPLRKRTSNREIGGLSALVQRLSRPSTPEVPHSPTSPTISPVLPVAFPTPSVIEGTREEGTRVTPLRARSLSRAKSLSMLSLVDRAAVDKKEDEGIVAKVEEPKKVEEVKKPVVVESFTSMESPIVLAAPPPSHRPLVRSGQSTGLQQLLSHSQSSSATNLVRQASLTSVKLLPSSTTLVGKTTPLRINTSSASVSPIAVLKSTSTRSPLVARSSDKPSSSLTPLIAQSMDNAIGYNTAGRKIVSAEEVEGNRKEGVSRVGDWLRRDTSPVPAVVVEVKKVEKVAEKRGEKRERKEKKVLEVEPTMAELLALEGPGGMEVKEGDGKYDNKSARGGRGGVVASRAGAWAQMIEADVVRTKSPPPLTPSVLPRALKVSTSSPTPKAVLQSIVPLSPTSIAPLKKRASPSPVPTPRALMTTRLGAGAGAVSKPFVNTNGGKPATMVGSVEGEGVKGMIKRYQEKRE